MVPGSWWMELVRRCSLTRGPHLDTARARGGGGEGKNWRRLARGKKAAVGRASSRPGADTRPLLVPGTSQGFVNIPYAEAETFVSIYYTVVQCPFSPFILLWPQCFLWSMTLWILSLLCSHLPRMCPVLVWWAVCNVCLLRPAQICKSGQHN